MKFTKTQAKLLKELASGKRRSFHSTDGRRMSSAMCKLRDMGLIASSDHRLEYYWKRRGFGRKTYSERIQCASMLLELTDAGRKALGELK